MAAKLAEELLASLGSESTVVYVQDTRGAPPWPQHSGKLLKSGKIVYDDKELTPMKFAATVGVKTSKTEQAAKYIYLESDNQLLYDAWKQIDSAAAESMKQLRDQLAAAGVKTFADLDVLWKQRHPTLRPRVDTVYRVCR
jgi:hypothetical protein